MDIYIVDAIVGIIEILPGRSASTADNQWKDSKRITARKSIKKGGNRPVAGISI